MGVWETAEKYIKESTDEYIRFWRGLSEIESPSAYKAGVDEAGEYTKGFAASHGLLGETVAFENAGNSLYFKGVASEEKPVLVMAHLDTVHAVGSFPKPLVYEKDGWLYGPGVFDCKGGVAVALLAASALRESGYAKRGIRLFFTGDEEVGHRNSDDGAAIVDAAKGCAAVFNCESGPLDGRLATGRKTAHGIKLHIKGVGAHSGADPEKGRSAILEAAHKIIKIDALSDIFGTGTIVYSALMNGGTVVNAIPEVAEVTISMRYKDVDDAGKKLDKIYELCAVPDVEGTSIEIEDPGKLSLPMLQGRANNEVYKRYAKAEQDLGFPVGEAYFAGGGSDATPVSHAGLPVLCQTGVRGENHHTLRERAVIASLQERALILTRTIIDFPDDEAWGKLLD